MYSFGRRLGGLLMHQRRGYFFKTCHKREAVSMARGIQLHRLDQTSKERRNVTGRGRGREVSLGPGFIPGVGES